MAQLAGRRPAGSGHQLGFWSRLGCGFRPWGVRVREATDVSLLLSLLPLSLKKINIYFKKPIEAE